MKVDLSTSWMGIPLPHPIVPGASPMSLDLDAASRLEVAGAPLLIMHSLFEEQVVGEELATRVAYDLHAESYAEATSYLPDPDLFSLGPDGQCRLHRPSSTGSLGVMLLMFQCERSRMASMVFLVVPTNLTILESGT